MAFPLITLTTDFGTLDHYVGVVKGVIAASAPEAKVIDITHQIPPYAIMEAAFTIAQTYPHFPPGAVHLIVVDPGVGSARRAIAASAAGQFFVAPDNGVLSYVLEQEAHVVHELTNDALWRKPTSTTFHGRDIFAPVAAALANGVALETVGPRIEDPRLTPLLRPIRTSRRAWIGAVLSVDRFGNLVTNFTTSEFQESLRSPFRLTAGLADIDFLAPNYESAPEGLPVAIAGSAGYIEIVVNRGSAAKHLGIVAGSPLELEIA